MFSGLKHSAIAAFVFMFFSPNHLLSARPPVICITQITSHSALDKVRHGFLATLKEAGLENGTTAVIHFENAQGSLPVAVQIAQKFSSLDPDVAVGITTPSAQALMRAFQGKSTPLVFASVTDPEGAGLVDSLKKPTGFMTGTKNEPPIDAHIDALKNLFPHIKKVGVIANISEANSEAMLKSFQQKLEASGFTLAIAPVTGATQVKAAAESLTTKIQVLILLQDNTVATAIPAVTDVMNRAKIPTLSSFIEATDQGALLAIAVNEEVIGQATGHIVLEILKGKKPSDIPVVIPHAVDVSLNTNTAKQIGFGQSFINSARQLFPKLFLK